MEIKKLILAGLMLLPFGGCDVINQVGGVVGAPTDVEMVAGLKDALNYGTGRASEDLHKVGGYLNNERFRIPFPPDAIAVADKLRQIGFGKQVDEFIERMNHGAEDAAEEARPIFVDAVRSMSFDDARGILLGADDAATQYFKRKTTDALVEAFAPRIKNSLDKFELTKYWSDITGIYNTYAPGQKVETDLVKYTTRKALDGLFLRLADEEKNIRNNVNARVTSNMKKAFDWASAQKSLRGG